MGEGGVARAQDKLLIERIEELMRTRQTNSAQLSRDAGLGDTAVYDIITGKNKNPSIPVTKAIAKALHTTVAYLVGETDKFSTEPEQRMTQPIPIAGLAEAGAFRRDMSTYSQEERLPTIDGPMSRHYPKADHFALEVRGDSMNAVREGAIMEGMYVLCVDMASAGISVESGKIYAIRRTMDHGQTYETTIKRARVYRDRIELVPESTNPAHEKITVPKDFDADPAQEVMAIGLVYGTVNDYEK
jgi:SOS-response transcriptional repressor LexA